MKKNLIIIQKIKNLFLTQKPKKMKIKTSKIKMIKIKEIIIKKIHIKKKF